MNDDTLLKVAQNGLMIAGHEMGPVGDHWPALNAIRDGLQKEFTAIDEEMAVVGELEFHLADAFRQFEDLAADANPADKAKILSFVKEMWESYYAVFEPVDAAVAPKADDLAVDDFDFKNIKAAAHIIKNLGGRA